MDDMHSRVDRSCQATLKERTWKDMRRCAVILF